MKKLMIVLALCAGMAQAETIATLRNKAGGLIVLTDVVTERCKGFAGAVYTISDNNQTQWGCWMSDELMVHVRWSDGDTRAYPIDNWTINEEVLKRFRERRRSGGQSL